MRDLDSPIPRVVKRKVKSDQADLVHHAAPFKAKAGVFKLSYSEFVLLALRSDTPEQPGDPQGG
jgi:hypothetical protein